MTHDRLVVGIRSERGMPGPSEQVSRQIALEWTLYVSQTKARARQGQTALKPSMVVKNFYRGPAPIAISIISNAFNGDTNL